MILGAMLLDPAVLTERDFNALLAEAGHPILVDELSFGVLCENVLAKEFMLIWISNGDDLRGRAGWNLAVDLVHREALTEEELAFLVGRIEMNLVSSPPNTQWAMNHCLCEIGIINDSWVERCLILVERLGVYRDMKVSKGCTSAYAPEWIRVGRSKRLSRT